jgi:hypothetical protein
MVSVEYIIQQVKEKLNKADSGDYDNMQETKILTAYNEGRLDWLRRNLTGMNLRKEGDEASKRRMTDYSVITTLPEELQIAKKDGYYLTQKLSDQYFEFRRLILTAKNACCENTREMVCYLVGESNVSIYHRSKDQKPSYQWGETYCTMNDHRLVIYTNDEFEIEKAELVYYRYPKTVTKQGVYDLESGAFATQTVGCEFKKDLVKLFILEAVKIISGNIESFNTNQISSSQVEENN